MMPGLSDSGELVVSVILLALNLGTVAFHLRLTLARLAPGGAALGCCCTSRPARRRPQRPDDGRASLQLERRVG